MIQRVQTIYLFLTLLALVWLTLDSDVFTTKVSQEDQFEMTIHGNVYGVQKDLITTDALTLENEKILKSATGKVNLTKEMTGISTFYFPFFSITILMAMLATMTILSYKRLKRQIRLGRMLFVANFFVFIGALILYYLLRSSVGTMSENFTYSYELGFGFYCIALALAFSFLSNIGMRRDLRLIQSIDRIR